MPNAASNSGAMSSSSARVKAAAPTAIVAPITRGQLGPRRTMRAAAVSDAALSRRPSESLKAKPPVPGTYGSAAVIPAVATTSSGSSPNASRAKSAIVPTLSAVKIALEDAQRVKAGVLPARGLRELLDWCRERVVQRWMIGDPDGASTVRCVAEREPAFEQWRLVGRHLRVDGREPTFRHLEGVRVVRSLVGARERRQCERAGQGESERRDHRSQHSPDRPHPALTRRLRIPRGLYATRPGNVGAASRRR